MDKYNKNPLSNAFILHIIIFICLIRNGSGLKCYICDTTLNETCGDITSNSNIKPQECDLQKQTSIKTWLADLNNLDLDFTSSSKIDTPMLCQKVVGTKGNGPKTTYRFCQLDRGSIELSDPCEGLKKKISKSDEKIELISCDVCREDNCNSAINKYRQHQPLIFIMSIGFITALSIILSKISL